MGSQIFTSAPGIIRAVRFIKGVGERNFGHAGKIYDVNGALLATTYSAINDDCEGGKWVTLALQTPLVVESSTQYLVVIDSVNIMAASQQYFTVPLRRGRLMMPVGAGVFGNRNTIPTFVEAFYNYFVDGKSRQTKDPIAIQPPLSLALPNA